MIFLILFRPPLLSQIQSFNLFGPIESEKTTVMSDPKARKSPIIIITSILKLLKSPFKWTIKTSKPFVTIDFKPQRVDKYAPIKINLCSFYLRLDPYTIYDVIN